MSIIPLLVFLLINFIFADLNSGNKNFKNLEKKTKILACTFLSRIYVESAKDYDKIFKDIMKAQSLSQSEAELKEKVSKLMLANCYLKITKEVANKLILEIPKGNKDIINNKEYFGLFEVTKDIAPEKLKETMKEINDILKEIKEEEEIFKKRKDPPDFEKAYKEFEEQMKKNNNNLKNKINENEQKKKNKKKKSLKKPYEGTKWETVKSSDENLLNLSDLIINPFKFFEATGMNTLSGMCISALILINIFQNISSSKKIEENKEENKKEEVINEINNIKKEDNEEDEENEEIVENDDNIADNDKDNEIKNEIKED